MGQLLEIEPKVLLSNLDNVIASIIRYDRWIKTRLQIRHSSESINKRKSIIDSTRDPCELFLLEKNESCFFCCKTFRDRKSERPCSRIGTGWVCSARGTTAAAAAAAIYRMTKSVKNSAMHCFAPAAPIDTLRTPGYPKRNSNDGQSNPSAAEKVGINPEIHYVDRVLRIHHGDDTDPSAF